jgi:hypothetical protein
MLRIVVVLIALVVASEAPAQEAIGCDKFKWPVERERTLLGSVSIAAKSGEAVKDIPGAVRMELRRLDEAALPFPPERAPRDAASFAGYLRAEIAKPGLYAVALTTNAWIDMIQNGVPVKTFDFSGVGGCEGIRKVVRFRLGTGPIVLQLSGNPSAAIAVAITPAE